MLPFGDLGIFVETVSLLFLSAPGKTRTCGLLIRSPSLGYSAIFYPISYLAWNPHYYWLPCPFHLFHAFHKFRYLLSNCPHPAPTGFTLLPLLGLHSKPLQIVPPEPSCKASGLVLVGVFFYFSWEAFFCQPPVEHPPSPLLQSMQGSRTDRKAILKDYRLS
jgi:hypothetical protein